MADPVRTEYNSKLDKRVVNPDDLARAILFVLATDDGQRVIREGVDARLRPMFSHIKAWWPKMEKDAPASRAVALVLDGLAAAMDETPAAAPREPAQDEPASGKCPRKAQDEPAAGVTPDVRALARETVLAAAVLRAAQTFEAYAAMHAAKGSVQGNKKAAVNKHLAENMRAALALSDPPDPTADIPALLAEVRRLREALGKRPCADGGLDRWTVSECIAAGECDCGARAALGEASNG